jgi:hypothetical protein
MSKPFSRRACYRLAGKPSQLRIIVSPSMLWRLPYLLVIRHLISPPLCLLPREASLLAEQFLQDVQAASCLQIAGRKALAQERGRHWLPCDACSVSEPIEDMRNAILRERLSCLREEEMIRACIHLFSIHRNSEPVVIQIRVQMTPPFVPQCESSLLFPFPRTSSSRRAQSISHRRKAQISVACIISKSTKTGGSIACCGLLRLRPVFVRRSASSQQLSSCLILYCFPTLAAGGVLDIRESKLPRGKTNEQTRAMS